MTARLLCKRAEGRKENCLEEIRLLTAEAARERLSVSRGMIYKLMRSADGFPVVEISPRCLRIDARLLDEWCREHMIDRRSF